MARLFQAATSSRAKEPVRKGAVGSFQMRTAERAAGSRALQLDLPWLPNGANR